MSNSSNQSFVPKFASFRPKSKIGESVQERQISEHSTSTIQKEEPHRRRHRHQSKNKEHHEQPTTLAASSAEVSFPPIFVVDRKGDRQNLVYGSNHRYEVPRFHRVGTGNVLGAPKTFKIDRDRIDDNTLTLTDRRESASVKREKYVFARNERRGVRLLRISPKPNGNDGGNLDFIPLSASRSKKRKWQGSGSDSGSDDPSQHYRSIEGTAKASQTPDEDMLYATDSTSSDPETGRTVAFDHVLKQKTVQLSKAVAERPHSIDAWLDLISHQDLLLGQGHVGRQKTTSAERRSTADIKIHLYEKALETACHTLRDRERLMLGMMDEGSKIWDFKAQSERWERISQENIDSLVLWKHYLDFRQRSFPTFRYEEILDVFLKRIKLIKATIKKDTTSMEEINVLYENLIYTVLRASLFIREAGHLELALCIWQGLLELNFFGPISDKSGRPRFELFREFWEAEVSRIGEIDSGGWSKFAVNQDIGAPESRSDAPAPLDLVKLSDVFKDWASAERLVATQSKQPARTMDDVAEDDPYRVILSSDIEDFLIDLAYKPHSEILLVILLDAYLFFCRLPKLSGGLHTKLWSQDSFIRSEMLEWARPWMAKEFQIKPTVSGATAAEEVDYEVGVIQPDIHCFSTTLDNLFPQRGWACQFSNWRAVHGEGIEIGSMNYHWIRNTLKALASGASICPEFSEYYLAFELCNESESARKTAKSLLKRNPENMRLYNAYAMTELSRGNVGMALNVISTALGMCTSVSVKEQDDCIFLWKSWTWALLAEGKMVDSLKCLLCMADGSPTKINSIDPFSPPTILKAKQHLHATRDYLLSGGKLYYAVAHTECLALLEYLSSAQGAESGSKGQGDIETALTVFDSFSNLLVKRGHVESSEHEILHQAASKLLYHHAQSGPFRPALLRSQIGKSLLLFPRNTIFLSLYTWNERRLRIDDRVRTILRDVVLVPSADSLTSRLFAIWHETNSGNVNSIRATFENAVSSPACSSNPGLWRLYVMFCVETKEHRKQAKDTFYRDEI